MTPSSSVTNETKTVSGTNNVEGHFIKKWLWKKSGFKNILPQSINTNKQISFLVVEPFEEYIRSWKEEPSELEKNRVIAGKIQVFLEPMKI